MNRRIGAGGGDRAPARKNITREQTQAVKAASGCICDVAAKYLVLRPVGKNMVGRCPICNSGDRTLTVSREFQNWRCWKCGKGGDMVALVMHLESVPFPLAVRFLAAEAGLESILPA